MKGSIVIFACAFLLAGCVQSYDSDYPDGRAGYRLGPDGEPEASSLFEMSVGGGDTKVTKNLPADAVDKLGDTIRSARD